MAVAALTVFFAVMIALPAIYDFVEYPSLIANVYINIVGSIIWTFVLLSIFYVIGVLITTTERKRISSFFGISRRDRRLTIFLSNIRIQPNGTIALEPVRPGYSGSAASCLEYQAAHVLREMVTNKPLNPMQSDSAEDLVGRIVRRFEQTDVRIKLSPLPPDAEPVLNDKHLATLETNSEKSTLKTHTASQNNTGDADKFNEVTLIITEDADTNNPRSDDIIASLERNPDTTRVEQADNSSNLFLANDMPSRQHYDWNELKLISGFWASEISECGSMIVIGSDLYNSIARFYADNYYNEHKSNYRWFPIFESNEDDASRKIVVREEHGQKSDSAKWAGKSYPFEGAGFDPAFIMRISDRSASKRGNSNEWRRSVIFCCGLTDASSAAAVIYLRDKWKQFDIKYGSKDFAVIIGCDRKSHEIVDIRQVNPAMFIEDFDLTPPVEPI